MMAVAGRPSTLDRPPQRQREAEAARCRSPAPPGDHALGGRCAVARRGGQGCWLFGGSGGHLRGVLVPPCDPQAQTTFSPPPRARSMVFYDGARAPWGLRRSPISARGECQQGADPSSPPLPESGLRAWQVLGGLRMRFLVCAGCAKGAWGRPKKDDWSTRVAAREQPEAPRLQFSSGGSHNILKFLAWKDSMEGPHPVLSRKKWRLCMAVGLV